MTKIALAQIASPASESRNDRITRVEEWLLAHSNDEVDLFVLPELWAAGYLAFTEYEQLAEPLEGPTVQMAIRVAKKLQAWVHVGSFIERDHTGKLYNTTALVDTNGEIAQIYRKIHVFGYKSREAQLLTPGTSVSVTHTPFGQLTSTTCYDLRFPGLWQEISDRGAEVAVVPAAWPAARREHFQLFTAARAVEHQLWVIAVNACGTQGNTELAGSSRVVNPWGVVIAECSPTEEELLIIDIDVSTVAEIRTEFPVLSDRLTQHAYAQLLHEIA